MKNITEELKSIINDSTTNLVKCWKITLKNGETIGFTNASNDFIFEDVKYNHLSSDDVENLKSNSDVENDTLQFTNLISSDLIKTDDILTGKYDSAKIEIFIVDLENLDKGKVSLLNGKIFDIQFKDNSFIANVKGLKNEIDKTIGDVYSPLCRTSFCSEKCKLNKVNFTFNAVISKVVDNISFLTENENIINKEDGYFENGVVEFLSGKNKGQKTEIKQFSNGLFMMSTELAYSIEVGDSFSVIAGCDKAFKTCCSKFNNAVNFRGEPYLPGLDLLLKVM